MKTHRYQERTLRIPAEVQRCYLMAHFHNSIKALRYADRLAATGFETMGDLDGKTDKEIRRLVRTTDEIWKHFEWSLGTYGAKFE